MRERERAPRGRAEQWASAIARRAGARHTVITDINPYRLELAKKMGATLCINPQKRTLSDAMKHLNMKEGFDVGMEMSGNPSAFNDMLAHMNHGGNIAFLGLPSEDFAIDWASLVLRSITVKGIYGRKMFETWYKGMSMLQSGLSIEASITDHLPAKDFKVGFEKMREGQAGKVILHWA
jgi:threonine 3-dehydrogenase